MRPKYILTASAFNRLGQYGMPAVPVTGPTVRRTRRFFPSDGRNYRQYSFCLLMDGWPGWVGLGSLVEYENGIPANGHRSQY